MGGAARDVFRGLPPCLPQSKSVSMLLDWSLAVTSPSPYPAFTLLARPAHHQSARPLPEVHSAAAFPPPPRSSQHALHARRRVAKPRDVGRHVRRHDARRLGVEVLGVRPVARRMLELPQDWVGVCVAVRHVSQPAHLRQGVRRRAKA